MVRFQTLGTIDLRAGDGTEIRPILSLNKRLALFSYLLLATPRGYHRRDTLIALFWPDMDNARARAALSRAVYDIRTAGGAEVLVNRGDEDLGVDWPRVQCDAVLFEDMVLARDWRAALDLYRGDLLPGFFVSDGSPEFDQWLDQRRAELRRAAADAAWRLAEREEANGKIDQAVHFARRHLSLRNADETALRNVMSLLDRAGDKAAAAGVYREFAERLATEFELEPSPETQQLLARIRERNAEAPKVEAKPSPASLPLPVAPSSNWRVRAAITAAAILALVLGAAALRLTGARAARLPVIAVGDIASDLASDSAKAFAALLTTNLARLEQIDVVSERRLNQLRTTTSTVIDAERAARMAGAAQFIEGTLSRRDPNTFRLDLRRVDLKTGAIGGAYAVEGDDLYELVDLAVDRIARDLDVRAPADRRGASTGSLVAYSRYEEGLRAYYRGDGNAAEHLFRSALEADSTFAMAAFFTALAIGGHGMDDFMARAVRLAERTNERERLLINATWAAHMQDPRASVWAESLVVRHPNDLDGRLVYARTLRIDGRRADAVPHYLHVIAADSANIGKVARCYACDAITNLVATYTYMDSLAAAERVARLWLRYQPRDLGALAALARTYEQMGRYRDAVALIDTIARYAPTPLQPNNYTSIHYRNGNFAAADRAWQQMKATRQGESQEAALWDEFISSRAQGRLRQALAAAHDFRRVRADNLNDPDFVLLEGLLEGHALRALGRNREAAALYDSIARAHTAPFASRVASHRTTFWTFSATALAAAGDTARLAGIEDSVRAAGGSTLVAMHRNRHFYIRGLRLAAQSRHLDAAREFERALVRDEENLALIYVALARSYIAANRPRDAIAPLVTALRGPISAAGLSVSHTDMQEMLGRAYEMAGQRDSAVIQYTRVLNAWRNADPEISTRRNHVQSRLAALAQPRGIRP